MPFARPTIAELIDRIGGDLRGRLEVGGPLLRRAMADVLSAVWAGANHTLFGFLDFVAKQLFATTAERDALLEEASMYGIFPTAAAFATGFVTATGDDGNLIPAGTIVRLDTATAYRVTTGLLIVAGQVNLPVIALLAGAAANLPAPTPLTFESPIDGVDATAVVASGDIDGGVDEEGTEEVRARLLLRKRQPPTGGSDQDYEGFALAVAGVTRAWVFPHEDGLGTVIVRFVRDLESPIFPDAGEIAAMQTALNAKRPVTDQVIAKATSALAVAFTIHIVPDTGDTRAAVAAELADLLQRVAEPGDGAGRGKILRSQIQTAIGIAAGVTDYTLTVPPGDVTPATGQLATVGTITFT